MGSDARNYESEQAFSRLIDNVSTETSWNREPTLGLNRITPMFSATPEERVWVSWFDRDRQTYFFRTRCTLEKTPQSARLGTVLFVARFSEGLSMSLSVSQLNARVISRSVIVFFCE